MGQALPILRTAELNTETYKKINAKLKHKGRQQNKAEERTHGRNNKLKNKIKIKKKNHDQDIRLNFCQNML